MKMNFRDLRADEVDVRIQQVKQEGGKPKGLVALLYKDARVDQNILDETVGAERWQREHYEVKGNMFCKVGIKCGDEWVWKSDCGTESNTEKEKGEASDSFKRACFNWGIGRELYTSPFIFIPADKVTIKDNGKGGLACYDKLRVRKITIENKSITGLIIFNETRREPCFIYGDDKLVDAPVNRKKNGPTPEQIEWAKKYVVPFGAHQGEELAAIYKTDRAHIDILYKAATGKTDTNTMLAIETLEWLIKNQK